MVPPAEKSSSIFPRHVEKHKLYPIIIDGYNEIKSNTMTGLFVIDKIKLFKLLNLGFEIKVIEEYFE